MNAEKKKTIDFLQRLLKSLTVKCIAKSFFNGSFSLVLLKAGSFKKELKNVQKNYFKNRNEVQFTEKC